MSDTHETILLAKTKAGCGLCEDYATRELAKPIVVMACEGACLRGELARLAANYLCDELAPEKTARLCLGGAFTKDTGQRNLAREAPGVVAIEGCPIECGTRMMQAVVPGLKPEVFLIPKLATVDPTLFSIKEMPEDERKAQAWKAAKAVLAALQGSNSTSTSAAEGAKTEETKAEGAKKTDCCENWSGNWSENWKSGCCENWGSRTRKE